MVRLNGSVRDGRTQVLSALAAGPYFSTVRLADELGLEPARARAIVDALDDVGHIRRDDGLAWTLTATGRAELKRAGHSRAWWLLRAPGRRSSIRRTWSG